MPVKCILVFFLLFISRMYAEIPPQKYLSVTKVPGWCVSRPVPEVSDEDLKQARNGYYYYLVDYQNHADLKEYYFRKVFRITNTSGIESSSEINLSFDPAYQKINLHTIKVIRNGKAQNRLLVRDFRILQRETDMEAHIYDGNLNALLILNDIRVGDIVELEYTLCGSNPVYGGRFSDSFYLRYGEPVKLLVSEYVYSDSHMLSYLSVSDGKTVLPQPVSGKRGSLNTITWTMENSTALESETNIPEWYPVYPYVIISEYRNWNEVARWSSKVFGSASSDLPAGFRSKISNWKNTSNSLAPVVDSIIKFVKDSIRYTGIEFGVSAVRPADPATVFKRRFGDCKDKSLLLASALKALGFKAWPALVNTSVRKTLSDYHPTPAAFNHCIVYAEISGEPCWIDPTITGQGGTYNTLYTPDYRFALVVDPEEKSLREMKVSSPHGIFVEERFIVNGFYERAILKVKTLYQGVDADMQRGFMLQNDEGIKKEYENFYAKKYPHITITDIKTEDNHFLNEVVVYEEYEIDSLWQEDTAKAWILTADFFPQVLASKLISFSTAHRNMPYKLEYPLKISEKIIIELPEDWNVSNYPKTIENDIYKFSQNIACEGKVVTLDFYYETKKDHAEAKEYKKVSMEQDKIYQDLGYSLTYDLNFKPVKSEVSTNWLMVLIASFLAFFVYLICKNLYHYNPQPLVEDPEDLPIGGGLLLIAVVLLVSPFTIIYQIIQNGYFTTGSLSSLLNSGGPSYNPGMGFVYLAEMFVNLFLVGFFILLNILFYRRRTSFRFLFTMYFPVTLVVFVFIEIAINLIDGNSFYQLKQTGVYVRLVVLGGLWMAYLYNSKRVNHTFSVRIAER